MRQVITSYSEYEWDVDNSQIRRVTGEHPPARFIGEDGQWRDYVGYTVSLDGGLWFWNSDGKGFVTSPVSRIIEISPEKR